MNFNYRIPIPLWAKSKLLPADLVSQIDEYAKGVSDEWRQRGKEGDAIKVSWSNSLSHLQGYDIRLEVECFGDEARIDLSPIEDGTYLSGTVRRQGEVDDIFMVFWRGLIKLGLVFEDDSYNSIKTKDDMTFDEGVKYRHTATGRYSIALVYLWERALVKTISFKYFKALDFQNLINRLCENDLTKDVSNIIQSEIEKRRENDMLKSGKSKFRPAVSLGDYTPEDLGVVYETLNRWRKEKTKKPWSLDYLSNR